MTFTQSLFSQAGTGFWTAVTASAVMVVFGRPFSVPRYLAVILECVAMVMGLMLVHTEMSCTGNCPHMPLEIIPAVAGMIPFGASAAYRRFNQKRLAAA